MYRNFVQQKLQQKVQQNVQQKVHSDHVAPFVKHLCLTI